MSWNLCQVKNVSGSQLSIIKVLDNNEEYIIPDPMRLEWGSNDDVLTAIVDGDLIVGNGTEYFSSFSDQIEWLKNRGECPSDTDGRDVVHTTPRYLGTFTYFAGRDDDPDDPHAVGGGGNRIELEHVASTKNISNVARSSNVSTIETSAAHGLETGAIIDVNCSDDDYDESDVVVTKIDATHFSYPNTGDDEDEKSATGTVTGDKVHYLRLSFNTINNISYIRQGDLMWSQDGADDVMATTFSIVPKTTAYSAGSNTNYNLYGGYLIVPAAGDGAITVADNDRVLVQNTPNEFGQTPAGYWDADWNTSTKQFENIAPNAGGTGEFNMFALEVVLFNFMYERLLMGTGRKDCMTDDSSRMGHNMLMRLRGQTIGDDHDWKMVASLMMYRTKTT